MLELTIAFVLIGINGLFSLSELALVSARKVRLKTMADAGRRGAQAALALAEEPGRFLSTVQIGITLVGILAGAFGGATVATVVSDQLSSVPVIGAYSDALGIVLVVLVITYLSLVVGELVPKRLALRNPEGIATVVARPMRTISTVARPAVGLLTISWNSIQAVRPVKM